MKRNALVLVIMIAAVASMIYFGVRMSRNSFSNTPATAQVGAAAIGKMAPDFELQTLDGKTVKLSGYRGKAVLVNFWATWCAPCKIEMPWFVDFYKQYQPQGLEIVGIAMDDGGKDTVASFAKEMNVNYTILMGKEAVGDAYGGVQFLPATFFIDRKGRVVQTVFGIKSKSDLENDIKKSLGE